MPQPSPQGGPWDEVDVGVTSQDELDAATQLPESLRLFLGTRLGKEDDSGCTTTELEIRAVHPDGYAFGSEDATCGTNQAIWGITDGQWNYLVAFDDVMPCADLETNEVPTGAPGLRCLDDDDTVQAY